MASSSPHPAQTFLFSLDTPGAVPVTADESYVRGWFVPQDGNTYELWLIADQTRTQAFTGLPRPDVARHHQNNPIFKNSGFLARFKRPRVPASATLIARANDSEVVLAEGIAVSASEAKEAPPGTEALGYRPLISILLPLPDAHPYVIVRCVESICKQNYSRWQLCIARESFESGYSREYLNKIAREDGRLKLVDAATGLISEHFNRALEVAEGDFVFRMDHRDELHPSALAEIAGSLSSGVDLVYVDEDEMDFYGHRGKPFSKPDFDPEAFLTWNFIGHGVAVRRSVLLEAGGYVADDWDALFRVLEIAGPSSVRHIPKLLYHYRRGDDFVAPPPREADDSAQAIRDHLARTGISATVEAGLFPGSFRLRYEKGSPYQIAVLVRSEDGAFQHAALAANVDPRTTRVYELLGYGADLLEVSRVPGGQPAIAGPLRNLGELPADVFIFINRPLDTVNHCFFDELASQAMRADCGLVTGIALDRTGGILDSGIHFAQGELPRNLSIVRSVDEISDEFFAVKRSQLNALGGRGAVYSANMPQVVQELAKLARSGGTRVLVTPYAVAMFDVDGGYDHLDIEGRMPQDESVRGPEDELNAAQAERKLAAEQLREISSERNRLRRELAAADEALARLETNQSQDLRQQIQQLNTALETERRITAGIQSSLSWKLTAPLRACMRLVRGK